MIADRAACEVGIRLFTTVSGQKDAELLLTTDTQAGEIKVAVSATVQASGVFDPNQPASVDTQGGGGGGGRGCVLQSENRIVDPTVAILFILALFVLARRSILRKYSRLDDEQYFTLVPLRKIASSRIRR